MIWLSYLYEYIHYLLRNDRDHRLGQHVDRISAGLFYPDRSLHRQLRLAKMAHRFIALMGDPDYRDRHLATITRAGF